MDNMKIENIQDNKKEGEDMPEELKTKKEENVKENSQTENDSVKARFKGLSMKNAVSEELGEEDSDNSKKEIKLEGIEQPTDHLSRMRLQMLAQKKLDKGLMEKEAQKVKTKEVMEKLTDLEEESVIEEQDLMSEELDKLKEKVSQLEKENAEYKKAVDKKVKEQDSEDVKKENARLLKANQKLSDNNDAYNQKINELQKACKNSNASNAKLEAKQEKLVLENTSLKDDLQGKNKELAKLKKQVESLEAKNQTLKENSSLGQKLEARQEKLLSENTSLKEDLQNKNKELIKLKKQFESLETKNQFQANEDLKEKLETENKNLKEELKAKALELEANKKKIEELSGKTSKVSTTKDDSAIAENKNLKKEIALKEKEIAKIQKQISALQEKVQLVADLKKEINSKKKENEKLLVSKEKAANDVKDKKKEILTLSKLVKKNEKTLEDLSTYKKDTTGLVKKINDDNEKLLKKVSELEERNQKIKKDYDEEISELNTGYMQAINERLVAEENIAKELSEKNSIIAELNERIEVLKNEILEAESNHTLVLEERLNNENNLAESLVKTQEVVKEQSQKIIELENALSSKVEVSESLDKDDESDNNVATEVSENDNTLSEEVRRIRSELDMLKQREVINLRRQSNLPQENEPQGLNENAILTLKDEIANCEKQLMSIKNKFESLDESAILDPEFRVKIRSIREMKNELLYGIEEEKKQFSKSFNELSERISIKNKEIKLALKKVENIDNEYEGTTNRTSIIREQYTAKRSKAMIELESIKTRCRLLEDEYQSLKLKYNNFNDANNRKLESINNAEMDIINYYLNQLKSDLLNKDDEYLTKTVEREELIEKLKKIESKQPLEDKHELLLSSNKLEQEIKALDSDYNQLTNKISILKEKKEERLESQRKVEENDKYIKMYIQLNEELSNYIKSQRDNESLLNSYREELSNYSNNDHSTTVKIRAKIQDIIIIQNDLQRKINDAKYRINDLTNNGRVRYYIDLLNSMEELNKKYDQIYSQMESVKSEITTKNDKLFEIKNELKDMQD
mgnify:FL=1